MTLPYGIVGGGVMGLSLACALARRGQPVALFEASRLGAGASGVPVALLNPHRGRSARATALDLAGLEAMRSLHREWAGPGPSGLHLGGVLRPAPTARQGQQWRALAHAGLRWLEPEAVPAPYHAPHGALLVQNGGWLEPSVFLAELAGAARSAGAAILEHHPVTGLERRGGAFIVRTPQGEQRARAALLCLGTGRIPGVDTPGLEHVAGDVLGLSPGPDLPYPFAGSIYGSRLGETLFVGGTHRSAPLSEGGDSGADAERLQRSAAHVLPGLAGATRTRHWTGLRARRLGNTPLVAELAPDLWVFGALAGRGFLCALHLAERWATARHGPPA